MHCIVTAGPTFEPLDQVRRLTNFSTGQLGSDLAGFLTARGHRVTLLRGYYAICRSPPVAQLLSFTTTDDLRQTLQKLADDAVDAVFHAAAVSDFRFGRVFTRDRAGELVQIQAGKLSTRQEGLLAELVPTPKIIAELRTWFPRAWLVGWKYEVDGSRAEALAQGAQQIQSCRTDTCVINGPAYGSGFGLLTGHETPVHCQDAPALFTALGTQLEAAGTSKGNVNRRTPH